MIVQLFDQIKTGYESMIFIVIIFTGIRIFTNIY